MLNKSVALKNRILSQQTSHIANSKSLKAIVFVQHEHVHELESKWTYYSKKKINTDHLFVLHHTKIILQYLKKNLNNLKLRKVSELRILIPLQIPKEFYKFISCYVNTLTRKYICFSFQSLKVEISMCIMVHIIQVLCIEFLPESNQQF